MALKEKGFSKLYGLDPSLENVNHLKQKGIRGLHGSIYCISEEDKKNVECLFGNMDAVFMTTVLEHLLEPRKAIEEAGKFVKEGGYLIIDIPDYQMVDKTNLPIPSQFNQEHINYFSEDSFKTMLLETDFYICNSELREYTCGVGKDYIRIFLLKKDLLKQRKSKGCDEKDVRTWKAIKIFFEECERNNLMRDKKIFKLYERQCPVIIWGTGATTMSLLSETKLDQCNILFADDSNPIKVGKKLKNMRILSVEEIKRFPNAVIVICAIKYLKDIKWKIRDMGLQNEVITL